MCHIAEHFTAGRDFINKCREKKGKVLVHCFAGKSRASTITLSYIMKEMQIDLKTSFEHLKAQRPIAQPNLGFLMQLKQFEKDLFGTNSDVPIKASEPNSKLDLGADEKPTNAEAQSNEEKASQTKELADSIELLKEKPKE